MVGRHSSRDPDVGAPRGGLISAILGSVFSLFVSPSEEHRSESALTQRAIQNLESQLTIKRVGMTYIISVAFKASSPERAAQIANAIADAYIVDQLEAKYRAT